MYPETNTPGQGTENCGDGCGRLPEYAPLAVPFVPFQQTGSKRYSQQDALANGTLYPGLNLPFRAKPEAVKLLGSELAELQALEFVLMELALYLDTHQEDSEAFALYQQYAKMEQEARARYEAVHGPLTQMAAANGQSWAAWLQQPWPWHYTEGGKK